MREILSRILCLHKKKERNAQQFRPLRVLGQGGKTTPIRRTAVRETSLSRHNRGSIEDTLKPQNTIVQWYTGGLRGPSIVPSPMIMRRFASDRCCFSKLVLGCILLTPTLAEGLLWTMLSFSLLISFSLILTPFTMLSVEILRIMSDRIT